MKEAGIEVNPEEAYAAALLHDVGIAKSPYKTEADEEANPWPEHAVRGAKDALGAGLPKNVAAAIQNHEGIGWTEAEISLLHLEPAVVGKTWRSNTPEAKAVHFADQIVYVVRNMQLDPWKDPSAVVTGNLSYYATLYQKRAGKRITRNHPVFKRILALQEEMLPYSSMRDVPPPWKGLSVLSHPSSEN